MCRAVTRKPWFLRDGGLLAGELGVELASERVQALVLTP